MFEWKRIAIFEWKRIVQVLVKRRGGKQIGLATSEESGREANCRKGGKRLVLEIYCCISRLEAYSEKTAFIQSY